MALFSRRRKRTETPDSPAPTADITEVTAVDEAEVPEPTGRGPWDITQAPELGERIDLGALRVPRRTGLKLRMEVEKRTGKVTATSLTVGGSALQVQAFAAPRTLGLWDDLRPEIAASVEQQGGTADEADGPFGRELLARLPVTTPEGRSGHRPVRFIGVDGPRWFLRGVISGRAAIDPDAASEVEDLFAEVVVVRGEEARAPRDVLALTLPTKPRSEDEDDASEAVRPGFDPLQRGPEITEIR